MTEKKYQGVVGPGAARARTLGFPTINIPLTETDVSGIYAATVTAGSATYLAAVYADQRRHILEAHVLNFSNDIQGVVTIELLKKIRESRTCIDDKALRAAIAEDVRAVRDHFHSNILQNDRMT